MRVSTAYRVALAILALTIVTSVLAGWWVSDQGYVSWFGADCPDIGYDPLPPYEELLSEQGLSSYCARRLHGETWD
jgi:hypothetical protein